jgi:hypothetical protein
MAMPKKKHGWLFSYLKSFSLYLTN